MIECPSCGRKHRPGTLFCSECGVYLPTGGPLGTEPIPNGELPSTSADAWSDEAGERPGKKLNTQLYIKVSSSDRQIPLPSTGEMSIGRLDAAHGIFPDADLTPNGGLKRGVSRRHCKIYYKSSAYLVEDLGSANGTFLNGNRLAPYLPHELENGDELQLGQIRLKIIIQ